MWWFLFTTAQAMTLQTALDAAEERSPSMQMSAERVNEAQARVNEARGRLLPTATVSAAAVAQNEVTVNFADSLPDIPLLDLSGVEPLVVSPGFQLQGAAEVTQPLFAPQAWAAGSAARQGVELARAEQETTQVRVRGAVLGAWHQSAQAHALVEDANVGAELADRLKERAQSMVDLGVASPDQILPFLRAVATANGNLAQAEAGAAAADGVLEQLTGIQGGADPAITPSEAPELGSLLDSVERADLDAAEVRVEAASKARDVERQGLLPVIAAKGGLYLLDPAPDLGEAVNWKVQVGATIPLFVGGTTRARISSAGARLSQAEAAQRAVAEQAQIEVRAAHGELSRSLAALTARTEALEFSEQAVAAAESRLDLGGGSLLEVQQAQAEQLVSRAELTRARSSAARAADTLWLAVNDQPR